MARLLSIATVGACAVVLSGMAAVANAAPGFGGHHTWYVQAAAPAGGNGSVGHPFDSLAGVQQASAPGDTIVVLRPAGGTAALDGGIALQTGQTLLGDGGAVTNTTLADNNGDAVELANGATVANLTIAGSARGGIYGLNVTGVTIEGNNVSGQNTSCTDGFFVLPFSAPSNTPGVGVSVPAPGLSNGWAAIMVDDDQGSQTVKIERNFVHDGVCGDGIDIRANGTGSITGTVSGNDVTRIPQGPGLRSVLAIGMQAQNASRLTVDVDHNTETDIGSAGADCEGLFANLNGSSHLTENVDHNTFTHGIGGASCNGLENILSSGPATSHLTVRNSSFTNDPGDMFEEANLGENATMTMDISHTTIADTTIAVGNNGAIPFNVGECFTATAAGQGDRVSVDVDHSTLTECNNALSVNSNDLAQNGTGPSANVDVTVSHSVLSQAAHYDLYWHNLTAIDSLSVHVDHTTLSAGTDAAIALLQEPGATTGHVDIDLNGDNDIVNNAVDVVADAYRIDARDNWWGSPAGPSAAQLQLTPPAMLLVQPVRKHG